MKHIPFLFLLLASPLFLPTAAASDATEIVTEAYEDVLGRKPDEEGMRNFRSKVIEKDWTAEDVRKALRKSQEYADLIITRSFEDVLGRKPDEGALNNYRRKVMQKGWSEKAIRKELRKSPEYKQKNR